MVYVSFAPRRHPARERRKKDGTMGNWQISESGTDLALDPQGRGEMTFTVTNASTAADRAVLTVNPLDGAADGWFTVTEPMRPVAAGASVLFPVAVAVPSGVAAGTFGLQGVAYSADTDPSETSATSKRVSLTVGAAAAPPRKGLPWWVFAAAGAAVLLVVIVFAVLLLGGGDDDGEATAATETTVTTDTTTGAGGGIIRTIPRDLDIFVPSTTTTVPPPELVEVVDTVGEPRATALALLSDDFDVRVEVDCILRPLSFTNPLVEDQDPRTGEHPRGSEVVIVTGPPILGNPCPKEP
jgi:hypothetical protein